MNRNIVTPPAEFSPSYFWYLNGPMSAPLIRRQLREMAAMGVRSVCPHPWPKEFRPKDQPSYLEPEYLSEEYFKCYKVIVEECRKLGMACYLYDEGGWPSGSGAGRVRACGGDGWAPMFWTANGVECEPACPHISSPQVNALIPGTVEKFIEITHEQYFRHFPRAFGSVFRFAFTDEPRMPQCRQGHYMTWCPDLEELFQRNYGYALKPHLNALLEDTAPAQIKIDFHDLLSKLFVRRFLLPIRTWCRSHRLLSGGHFGGEDEPETAIRSGHGHIMRSLRALDLPGVDAIWRQVFPGKANRQFPKFASSIAHQAGRKQVLAELFAVYGSGVTPEQRQFLIDYMLVRGVNTLVFSALALTRQRQFMQCIRPHFGSIDPLWKYSRPMHEGTARAAWLLTRGVPVVPTALYFDMRSLWAGGKFSADAVKEHHALANRLMQSQCDFDFVDDDALSKATIRDGLLCVGRMRYSSIVMTHSEFLPEDVKRVVQSFASSEPAPLLGVTPAAPMLRVCKRQWGRRAIYFCVNEGAEPLDVTLTLKESPALYLDIESLKEFRLSGASFKWHFEPFGSAFFLTGKEGREALKRFVPSMELQGPWMLRALRKHVVGKDDFEVLPCRERARSAALGDWRPVVGDDFSGDAVYETTFTSDEKRLAIDLGRVCYSAAVTLNGIEIGSRLRGPFVFDLTPALKRGKNILRVTVSNTLANAIAAPGVLERQNRDFPPQSPYEERQRVAEAESLPSGLFGPVRIGELE